MEAIKKKSLHKSKMKLKKLSSKFLFVVTIFSFGTFLQIAIVAFYISSKERYTAINANSFRDAFADTFNILGGIKLVFFLPLYLLCYLFIKNLKIILWIDGKRLILNGIAVVITGILLPAFVFFDQWHFDNYNMSHCCSICGYNI